MFTGIITGLGQIAQVQALGAGSQHGLRLQIQAPAGYLQGVAVGDSIAINGACMTATELDAAASWFRLDISAESLARTAGLDRPGPVNLEKALRLGDTLDGHLVLGHVDGVGKVLSLEEVGESWELLLLAPAELAPFLAYKGSVAVNGVSLTINRVQDTAEGCRVHINLIPHTVQHTTLGTLVAGSRVNLEIDPIARYVARMQELVG